MLDAVDAAGNKTNINTDFLDALAGGVSVKALKDFYLIGLWSYCEGEKIGDVETITYCSPPKFRFWFDPTDVWGLKITFLQDILGDKLQKGLDAYRKTMGWMSDAFIFATILTATESVLSLFAIFSKKGSLMICIAWMVGCS
jgi:hypothetical protein